MFDVISDVSGFTSYNRSSLTNEESLPLVPQADVLSEVLNVIDTKNLVRR
jgi:hypothetical protein